jgi:putative radical SAM enzyme (TIGR03279 family)
MLLIDDISQDSPAEKAGLLPGDSIISADWSIIHDALDLQFYIEDERFVELVIQRSGNKLSILLKNPFMEPTGIIPHPIGLRRCNNNCIFCFIDQQPKELRDSLHVKDEDIRHSFLYGNYITLSNTPEWEIERVIEQKMSPLYISVHSTDEDMRRKLLRNDGLAPILPILKRLTDGGVRVHSQIVIVPGFNDSAEILTKTVQDLYKLGDNSLSCAIVPIGLTRYRDGLTQLRPVTSRIAEEIIDLSDRIMANFSENPAFLQLADELFLLAGKEIPPIGYYGDFPQLENGVGMVCMTIDDAKSANLNYSIKKSYDKVLVEIVTGIRGAMIMEKYFPENLGIDGVKSRITAVENRFWGSSVDAANLLIGKDIRDAISGSDSDIIYLPPDILNADGLFLDNRTVAELQRSVDGEIVVGPGYLSEIQVDILSRYD